MNHKILSILIVFVSVTSLSIFAVMCGKDGSNNTKTTTNISLKNNEGEYVSEISVSYFPSSKNNKIIVFNPGNTTAANVRVVLTDPLVNAGVTITLLTDDGADCQNIQVDSQCVLSIDTTDKTIQDGVFKIEADNIGQSLSVKLTVNEIAMCATLSGKTCSVVLPLKDVEVSLIPKETRKLTLINNTDTDVINLSIEPDREAQECTTFVQTSSGVCENGTLKAHSSCDIDVTATNSTCPNAMVTIRGTNSLPLDLKISVSVIRIEMKPTSGVAFSSEISKQTREIIGITSQYMSQITLTPDPTGDNNEKIDTCLKTENLCASGSHSTSEGCNIIFEQIDTSAECESLTFKYLLQAPGSNTIQFSVRTAGPEFPGFLRVTELYLTQNETVTITNASKNPVNINKVALVNPSECITLTNTDNCITQLNVGETCTIDFQIPDNTDCISIYKDPFSAVPPLGFYTEENDESPMFQSFLSISEIKQAEIIQTITPPINPLTWGNTYTLTLTNGSPIDIKSIKIQTDPMCNDCLVDVNYNLPCTENLIPKSSQCTINFSVANIWAPFLNDKGVFDASVVDSKKLNSIKIKPENAAELDIQITSVQGLDVNQIFPTGTDHRIKKNDHKYLGFCDTTCTAKIIKYPLNYYFSSSFKVNSTCGLTSSNACSCSIDFENTHVRYSEGILPNCTKGASCSIPIAPNCEKYRLEKNPDDSDTNCMVYEFKPYANKDSGTWPVSCSGNQSINFYCRACTDAVGSDIKVFVWK